MGGGHSTSIAHLTETGHLREMDGMALGQHPFELKPKYLLTKEGVHDFFSDIKSPIEKGEEHMALRYLEGPRYGGVYACNFVNSGDLEAHGVCGRIGTNETLDSMAYKDGENCTFAVQRWDKNAWKQDNTPVITVKCDALGTDSRGRLIGDVVKRFPEPMLRPISPWPLAPPGEERFLD